MPKTNISPNLHYLQQMQLRNGKIQMNFDR